jgi:hypothetical protein
LVELSMDLHHTPQTKRQMFLLTQPPSVPRTLLALLSSLSLFGFHDDRWIQRITAKLGGGGVPEAFRTGTETV